MVVALAVEEGDLEGDFTPAFEKACSFVLLFVIVNDVEQEGLGEREWNQLLFVGIDFF